MGAMLISFKFFDLDHPEIFFLLDLFLIFDHMIFPISLDLFPYSFPIDSGMILWADLF